MSRKAATSSTPTAHPQRPTVTGYGHGDAPEAIPLLDDSEPDPIEHHAARDDVESADLYDDSDESSESLQDLDFN